MADNWTCSTCSWGNTPARTMCEMCMTDKSSSAVSVDLTPLRALGYVEEDIQTALLINGNDVQRSLNWLEQNIQLPSAAAPPLPQGVSEEDLSSLMSAGFDRISCINAIASSSTLDEAFKVLLSMNRTPITASDTLVTELSSMGFTPEIIQTAMDSTGSCDRDAIISWLLANPDGNIEEKEVVRLDDMNIGGDEMDQRIRQARIEEQKRLVKQVTAQEEHLGVVTEIMKESQEQTAAKRSAMKRNLEKGRLKRMADMRKAHKEDTADLRSRIEARMEEEDAFSEVGDIMKSIHRRYKEAGLRKVANYYKKILSGICNSDPDHMESVCRIDPDSTEFKEVVVQHVGCFAVLRLLGFTQEYDPDNLNQDKAFYPYVLLMPDTSFLQEHLDKFQKLLDRRLTKVGTMFREDEDTSVDVLLLAALGLEEVISNVVINPTSKLTKYLHIDSDVFQGTLEPLPFLEHVLQATGFAQQDTCFVLEQPNLKLLKKITLDLRSEISSLILICDLQDHIHKIVSTNSPKKVAQVLGHFQRAVETIIRDPLTTKFQRLNINRLFGKQFHGGLGLLYWFHFQLGSPELDDAGKLSTYAVLPFPHPTGFIEVFRHKLGIFKKTTKHLV